MVISQNLQSIHALAKQAIEAYFQPISYALSLFDKSFSFEVRYKRLKQENLAEIRTLRTVQNALCLNQGNFLQYSFVTAEKHKALKAALHKDASKTRKIATLKKNLTNFINEQFYINTYENFKLLHNYFKSTGRKPPRISIKGSFKDHEHNMVVTVFRDSKVGYEHGARIAENKGFNSVYENGTYFLENNIPKAALNRKYYNQRLISENVEKYFSGASSIKEWKDCWKDSDGTSSSFYKSTLIVPMTLWNNKLSDEFKKLINMENVDRTIFGFLCFDHAEENYFDKDKDVAIGYVFADIISMYLFTRLVYTDASNTFEKVEKLLKDNRIKIKLESLDAILKELPDEMGIKQALKFKPKKSRKNSLHPLDEDLISYVKKA